MNTSLSLDRIPGEPVKCYAALQRYLSLGPGRTFKALARELKIAPGTLRRWAAKYDWHCRTDQHDLAVIKCEQDLQEAELQRRAVNWIERREELRMHEWAVSEETIQRAREILRNPRMHCELRDVVELLEIGSILGRRATGLPLEGEPNPDPNKLDYDLRVQEMIRQVYGAGTSPDVTAADVNKTPGPPSETHANTEVKTQPRPRFYRFKTQINSVRHS